MADDITTVSNVEPAPQDTTTTQDIPATDQPIVQPEPPKAEEQPTETSPVETPKEETLVEEPKPEEQKPVEETKPAEEVKTEPEKIGETPKPEEKPKDVSAEVSTKVEEVKTESETPKPPQINLDELRVKANKERQDRKQEHLAEVEKLAKSKQINNHDVRELLHVSQSTATNYLEELTKQGKIKKSGKAKSISYTSK